MQGLEPRTISIEVTDKREVSVEDRRATEAHLAQSLGEVFSREGVQPAVDSPNVLAVTLQRPSSGVKGIDPETCVEMVGNLELEDGRSLGATTLGCAEFKNALGMSYGGHVSGAFQYAANTLLQSLDKEYAGANRALVFESAKIEVPAFPEIGVSALRLTVKDEYSQDASVGQNLTNELMTALTDSGVNVDEKASQTMTVTLSRPTEDFAGRDKATCMVIEVKAKLERATAFSHGTACRGMAATAHHKVLSEALLALWTEYGRLSGK